MTRWILNVGDPVYTIDDGVTYKGHVLATFVFRGTRHFVIGDENGFVVRTNPRPDKKQVFTSKRGLNEEM